MIYIQLAIAAVIAIASGYGAHHLTAEHYLKLIADARIERQAEIDKANLKADSEAQIWQTWAEAQPAKIIYRDRKIRDAFKANPVWASASIPSGVRDQLAAADAVEDPGSAPGAVPAAASAPAADQRGSRSSLSGVPRFIRELFQTPSSTH